MKREDKRINFHFIYSLKSFFLLKLIREYVEKKDTTQMQDLF